MEYWLIDIDDLNSIYQHAKEYLNKPDKFRRMLLASAIRSGEIQNRTIIEPLRVITK